MSKTTPPTARQSNLVVQDLENEVLIYDLTVNKAFYLNETSAFVWKFSNGKNSIPEIADLMSKKLKILVSEEVVWLALDQLKKYNLLENSTELDINFNGLTRRQIVKKVGLASMITLPLVSSVIAPSAANAQSVACIAPGAMGCTVVGGGTQSNCCASDQRCHVVSVGATCNPCVVRGFQLGGCRGTGCCASDPNVIAASARCCNSGPLTETPAFASDRDCFCP